MCKNVAALSRPTPDAGEVQAVPGRDWQPIATAPRDGTYVHLACADGTQSIAHWAWRDGNPPELRISDDWSAGGWVLCWMDEYIAPGKRACRVVQDATHWRPLPAPPAAAIRKLGE
jgi:hypothetical protein